MTKQELILTLEERVEVYRQLNNDLPRHIIEASPEMKENRLLYAQIEKVLEALPELAKEAGYDTLDHLIEQGVMTPDMLEQEGFVKLANDQSLPMLYPEGYSEGLILPDQKTQRKMIAYAEDMLKAGWRKIELEEKE